MEDQIRAILKNRKFKIDDKVDALMDLVGDDGDTGLYVLDINDSRAPIETVEIGDLRIGVDANGRAAAVSCGRGFFADDQTREF